MVMCRRLTEAEVYLVRKDLVGCERWKKKEGLGYFICRHMRGYKEASAHLKGCDNCDRWKEGNFIKGDFWCRHNKYKKREWDQSQRW